MSQKSYDNSPSLYLIPTPIGNLDDITLRTIKTLEQVEVIFAEDTRVTANLLKHLNISKKLISNHNYNETDNHDKLLEYLKNGKDVGIVTDRGTPVISDPGYELVKVAIENNYNVIALPGPTALIPALIVSGLEPSPFLFYGFLNNKEEKRKKELENLKKLDFTIIFYESPHRVEKTLNNMLQVLGDRKISISREISKKFEEVYRGKISTIINDVSNVKGELVLVLEKNKEENNYDNLTIVEHVNLYIKEGYDVKESIKKTSQDRQISKNEVYKIYHNIN
ncbi:MAG: 16S rRNA (cytidine(1402)-2'-O)-methyltransferase [Bacilli bacterium]|nr:16S rRNA (cytidine(1402)-2'-O)-methyltransferase [Bacilli bacterium]MDD4547278.1 16S rRNA (cytidine(1402)-2'-O)-methyltransferase [Bacilli bacterium]